MIEKTYLKKIKSTIRLNLIKILQGSLLLSKAYYFLSDSFDDEIMSLVSGKFFYWRHVNNLDIKNYRLRRFTHVLEKGLIRNNRKKEFSVEYMNKMLEILRSSNISKGSIEYSWAVAVLDEYFKIIDQKKFKKEKKEFENIKENNSFFNEKNIKPNSKPFLISDKDKLLSYDDLLKLSLKRRSVRYYKNKPVSERLISKALKIAELAPSACNRQPFRFIFIRNKMLINKIGKLIPGARGFYDQFPLLSVVIGETSHSFDVKDRNIIYIDSSLSIMLLCLGLETLGLSSCIYNWPEIKSNDLSLRKILKLNEHDQIITTLSIGYPERDLMVPGSAKNIQHIFLN